MNVCKLRPGLHPIHVISKEQFESDTKMESPWYQANQQGVKAQFAVCPACDNPIQIVAMYERSKNSPACHGRHVPRTVPRIAVYDQQSYDACPYANPGALHADARIAEGSQRGKDILQLLRQEFDRVIYILQQVTGVRISDALAKNMLQSFLSMRGHLYMGTTLCNLPWMFGYMAAAQSLYGRMLHEDSPLMLKLKNNARVLIEGNGQVKSANGSFLDITFCFMHHAIAQAGTSIRETLKFVVSIDQSEIYQERVEIDTMYFHNLVNLPPERARRNERLLSIAQELLPE